MVTRLTWHTESMVVQHWANIDWICKVYAREWAYILWASPLFSNLPSSIKRRLWVVSTPTTFSRHWVGVLGCAFQFVTVDSHLLLVIMSSFWARFVSSFTRQYFRTAASSEPRLPANTKHWPNAGSMLGQRRRRWSNNKPALGECFVFDGSFLNWYR